MTLGKGAPVQPDRDAAGAGGRQRRPLTPEKRVGAGSNLSLIHI